MSLLWCIIPTAAPLPRRVADAYATVLPQDGVPVNTEEILAELRITRGLQKFAELTKAGRKRPLLLLPAHAAWHNDAP